MSLIMWMCLDHMNKVLYLVKLTVWEQSQTCSNVLTKALGATIVDGITIIITLLLPLVVMVCTPKMHVPRHNT